MRRAVRVWGWALVLSVGALSAVEGEAPPPAPQEEGSAQEEEGAVGQMGDEELEGLGIKGTGVMEPAPKADEKRTDLFIQGAFCMLTLILFTAGFVGTKSHKGERVITTGGAIGI